MQVDAGSFILTIEQEFERVATEYEQKGLLDAGEELKVIAGHLLTRASLAAMIKHSRQAGLTAMGMAPNPMDEQTKSNIIKAIGDGEKFRARGRKAADTRRRNAEARARETSNSKPQDKFPGDEEFNHTGSGPLGIHAKPAGGDGGAA